ncbi:unnamed protein product [Psylliodes chrysocephalus]|uniref:Uncharacterized protein n=1 Tax=Psylliodes chrysocephalus TaxID=3402493 RepID=A0A9P0CZ57_9CUCU|nr:unnamed protein product [Psylliodes chrysocephala]
MLDEELKQKFNQGYQKFWLQQHIETQYPVLWNIAEKYLISLPSSYLVEKGFSVVTNILTKQRNCLIINEREDLRLQLTNIKPDLARLRVGNFLDLSIKLKITDKGQRNEVQSFTKKSGIKSGPLVILGFNVDQSVWDNLFLKPSSNLPSCNDPIDPDTIPLSLLSLLDPSGTALPVPHYNFLYYPEIYPDSVICSYSLNLSKKIVRKNVPAACVEILKLRSLVSATEVVSSISRGLVRAIQRSVRDLTLPKKNYQLDLLISVLPLFGQKKRFQHFEYLNRDRNIFLDVVRRGWKAPFVEFGIPHLKIIIIIII